MICDALTEKGYQAALLVDHEDVPGSDAHAEGESVCDGV